MQSMISTIDANGKPIGYSFWFTAGETYKWATKPGAEWPCSRLKGKRLYIALDRGNIVDIEIGGLRPDYPNDEIQAFLADNVPMEARGLTRTERV